MPAVKTPAVPDGVYRIRSADRSGPALYLERQTDSEVKPVALNTSEANQKWKFSYQSDGTYHIVGFGSSAALSILSYQENGVTKYRLYSGGQQFWTLDPRADQFVLGNPDNAQCVDIANNNWVILWERKNTANQRWILESVDPAGPVTEITAGRYQIMNSTTNRATRCSADTLIAELAAWDKNSDAWIVTPIEGRLYQVAYPGATPMYLCRYEPFKDTPNTVGCSTTSGTCRIVPVAGSPGLFNILFEKAGSLKAFHYDENEHGTTGYGLARMKNWDPAEKFQQWKFVAC